MAETIKLDTSLERNVEATPCPKCNGYCDHVPLTKQEIKEQSCSRSYECCSRAFECRICKTRIVASLDAPEMVE